MAQVTCPVCLQAVSASAAACPHCGHSFQRPETTSSIKLSDPVVLIGVILAILMVIGIIGFIIVRFS